MSATTTRVKSGSSAAPLVMSSPSETTMETKTNAGFNGARGSSYNTYISIDYIQRMCLLIGTSRTLLAPLDRVKFIMQTQKELIRHGTLAREFHSAWDCARYLSVIEGNRSFWRGNLIQVVSICPIIISQLIITIPVERYIFESFPLHSALCCTAASYAALLGGSFATCLISYPLDFARFRLAVDVKFDKDAAYAFKHSLAFFSHPVLSEFTPYLYRGLTLFVLANFLYRCVYNVLIGVMMTCVPPEDGRWWPIFAQTTAGIGVAGVATVCLHPIDLVRHRLMIAVTSERLRYASAMSCVRRIAKKEGLRGFYRGSVVTLVKMLAATGLTIVGLPF
ncbi:unnamed protein product [Phytomonas sp. Hart1]|nr:unnamed protein product [Phytomonas sp. Hart1]|eukprot:CCW71669.1 unnamed protein product [Phytomonas sp. isolate Hart1]